MNKNGVKLLAAVMVFAMALAGAALLIPSSDVDADSVNVAEIGETGYETLSDAIGASDDGDTITLIGNTTTSAKIVYEGKSITIDLNGYSINATVADNDSVINVDAGSLTVKDSSESKTGKIVSNNYGLSATNGGSITINGGTIESKYACLAGNNTKGDMSFVVNGGVLTSGMSEAIYMPGQQSLTITAGTINGGISTRMGQISITGGIIKALTSTADPIEDYWGYSGSAWIGDAIFVMAGTYTSENEEYGNSCNINITGGEINGLSHNAIAIYDIGNNFDQNVNITISEDAKIKGSIQVIDLNEMKADLNSSKGWDISKVGTKVVSVTTTITGEKFTIAENSTLKADITFVNIGDRFTISKGATYEGVITTDVVGNESSAEIKVTASTGGVSFEAGSVIIEGELDSSVPGQITVVSGNAKLIADVPNGTTIIINAEATLEVPAGEDITVAGVVTNNGTLVNNGTITNSGGTITNNKTIVQSNDSKIVGAVTGANGKIVSAESQSSDATGLSNFIDFDLTLTTKAFLEGNLTVKEGYTLTISTGASLNLNGYKLILEGNLVILSGGYIAATMDGNAEDGTNTIGLTSTGSISNSGVIGKGSNAVAIAPSNATTGTALVQNVGSVSLVNVSGASFGIKKNVNSGTITYTLMVSGNIYKDGVGDAKITVTNAIIGSDMTIGNDVTFTGSNATVAKDVALTIDGTATGSVFIQAGAIVQFNGKTSGEGLAVSGYSQTVGTTDTLNKVITITVKDTNGIKVYAESETYMDGNVQKTRYTILLSGAPAGTGTGATSKITADVSAPAESDKFVYIDEELTFDAAFVQKLDSSLSNAIGVPFKVTGKITYPNSLSISNYYGTSYSVQTEVSGSPITTKYITSFDAAFGVIDTTVGKEITVVGDIDLSNSYELAAKQKITITAPTKVVVKSTGSLTIAKEGIVNGTIDKVEGIVTVIYGGNVTGINTYDVKTTASNGDVTYSGILIAIENAQAGQTVTVVGEATIADSALTIPEGVKVVVSNGASLAVGKDLNVKGELTNSGTVTVGKNLNVTGKVDATAGAPAVTGKITSAGEFILPMGTLPVGYDAKINSAVYKNDDGNYVITTIAKAINASAAMDVPSAVDVYGEVSEDSTVTAKKVNINIKANAVAVISDLTIQSATVTVEETATLTGKITGQSGTDGSTVASTISMTKASEISIVNSSSTGTDGVKKWKTAFSTTDADDLLSGKVTIDAGIITITNDLKVYSEDTTTPGELKVASDATLVVASGAELTSTKGISVDGKLQVSGEFTAIDATVAGELLVKKDGSVDSQGLVVTGTIVIENTDSGVGTFLVSNELVLGEAPKTLGEGVSIAGPITIGANGYIIAYPGAQISVSDINEGAAVSTELIINGYTYATVYGKDGNNVSIFGNVFGSDFVISGLNMSGSNTPANWKSDEAMTLEIINFVGKNAKIYFSAEPALKSGKISTGAGLALYIDGLSIDNYWYDSDSVYKLTVGDHVVTYSVLAGYDGSNAKITFNGQTVGADGKIVVSADIAEFVLAINGATPAVTPTPEPTPTPSEKDDSMGITEYLLIVLVVLAAILVVVVAIRMMRS